MICAAIRGVSVQEIVYRTAQASPYAQILEVRLDSLDTIDYEQLPEIIHSTALPIIFTLRSVDQGGAFTGPLESHLTALRYLAALRPAYLDIERGMPPEFVEELAASFPELKFLISYHNFEETPDDLDALLESMKMAKAHWYKIAVKANSTLDMLRLMAWVQDKQDVIAISMGEAGQPGRLISQVVGCPLTIGCVDGQETAPGQLPVELLSERYRADMLRKGSCLYGLIGDPVDRSISDRTHNNLMKALGLDAVYVKMSVKPEELDEFFQYVKKLPFKGLSVTMPLKEHIMQYLDEIDSTASDIGAVNTLLINEGKINGYNTDAMGALNALETLEKVVGKRVVVIGAGGAAKAIAYEACRRGAIVTVVNRNSQKAQLLAAQLGCGGLCLDEMKVCVEKGYEMLINTTPVEMPIDQADIISGSIVMDIKTHPKNTELLEKALEKGCRVMYGYSMFVEQAIGQFVLWYGGALDSVQCRDILNTCAEDILNEDRQ